MRVGCVVLQSRTLGSCRQDAHDLHTCTPMLYCSWADRSIVRGVKRQGEETLVNDACERFGRIRLASAAD